MNRKTLKIYFAGDLFDAKDLGGNVMLAEAIRKLSGDRYLPMLPQNGECEVTNRTSRSIRDADFDLLYSCDVIVANFDGTDPDSGTVVEFCFAKMTDMPAVLLRTDFRNSGDSTLPDGEPWNLMCSHYPRTKVLHINGMVRYHECKTATADVASCLAAYYDSIAADVISALDRVTSETAWLKKDQLLLQYQMAVKSIGGGFAERFTPGKLTQIVQEKIDSGLYD